MKRRKIFWQIFPAYIAVVIASLAAVLYFSAKEINDLSLQEKQRNLTAMAKIVAERVSVMQEAGIQDYCKDIGESAGVRITIIDSKGKVLGDTDKKPRMMDNHIDREEIQDALNGETAMNLRYSDTTKMQMLYVAVPMYNQSGKIEAVARVSVSNESVREVIDGVTDSVINAGIITALIAAVVSLLISKRISSPISSLREGAKRFRQGQLEYRLPTEGSYETVSLAKTMNEMADELNKRIKHITEQQAKVNAILSSMTEAVIAVDNRNVVIMANNAAIELFDMPVDCVGRTIEEAARDPQLQKTIEKMIADKTDVCDTELMIFKQGRQIVLQVHGTLLLIEDIQIGVLVVLSNVTRIKRLENIRKEFVANVSHELKTPITSIKGFVETLRDGAINDKENAAKFLDIIARQTSRLEAIIEDLLALSRIEQMQDNTEVELEKSFVKPIVYGAVAACKLKADNKGISVNVSCDDQAMAKVNPNLIEQAIINLIDNAIKYSDNGQKVEVYGQIEDGKTVITVKDYGCGIDADDLERIFERFYRVDKARSSSLGGTGLGLSIVKHIVNAHKGRVDVQSKQGEGSSFKIILP